MFLTKNVLYCILRSYQKRKGKYHMQRFLKITTILLLISFFIIIILVNNSFIFCREARNYDAVFEIVGTNIIIAHSPIGIKYNLFIRDANNPNEIHYINVTSSVYAACGIGQFAIFNVQIIETFFGQVKTIITFKALGQKELSNRLVKQNRILFKISKENFTRDESLKGRL